MQSQKFTSVVESMQRGETLVALKTISTLISKEKNKAKLSETELKLILLLKALCLVKIHDYGESLSIVTDFLKTEKDLLVTENSVIKWLDHIAANLDIYKEVREFANGIYNKAGNKEEHLIEYMNFCLKEYNYHEVSSAALRLYKLTTNPRFMLVNVVFQHKALVSVGAEPKKLEIVCLFTEKLLKEIKVFEATSLERLQQESIQFAVSLYVGLKKFDKALDLLTKFNTLTFQDNIAYLDYFYTMNQELKTPDSRLRLINQNLSKFRKDRDLDSFVMEFLIYDKFLSFLFQDLDKFTLSEADFQPSESEGFLDLTEDKPNIHLLKTFLRDLINWKNCLNQAKTHRNYRFALQIVLSTEAAFLRRSLIIAGDDAVFKGLLANKFNEVLEEYVQNFGSTLTFPEEILVLISKMEASFIDFAVKSLEKSIETIKDKQNIHIRTLGLLKLKLAQEFDRKGLENKGVVEGFMKEAIRNYFHSFEELELEKKHLEKGERHLSDEFLTVAADILMIYIRATQTAITSSVLGLMLNMAVILEMAVVKSPYNFDLKLKLLVFYDILACPEHSIEILRTLDVKSVQHDTLGFLYAKIYLNFHNPSLTQDLFTSALNFYSENRRESKESLLSCVKNGGLSRTYEFEQYDEHIDRSYFKQLCFLSRFESLLRTPKHDHSIDLNIEYYKDFLIKRLEKVDLITWNFDQKVFNPNFLTGKTFFWRYLDIFNDPEVLKSNFYKSAIVNCLGKPEKIEEMEKLLILFEESLKKVSFEALNDFKRFKTRNPVPECGVDKLNSEILKGRLSFEMKNLKFEKHLLSVLWKVQKFKQEESYIEQVMVELKEISTLNLAIEEYFHENLKKEPLTPEFPREVLMSLARYVNKTLDLVQRALKQASEVLPLLNKASKKGEEELRKKTSQLLKACNALFKEILESGLKNLSLIQDFLQILTDLCGEQNWGKLLKERIRENKTIREEIEGKTDNSALVKIENMVVWTLMNEYCMCAALNGSNAKEAAKNLKSLKL